MSLKYAATKVSEGHYVLPKTKDMKVDAHAYLSEALYEASDETLWDQLRNGASYEGVTGAYIMPDAHMGYGVPIGSVIVTEDTLIQAGSGYDISCGVLYMSTGLMAADIADLARRRQWIEEIVQRVALGVGSNRPSLMPSFDRSKADDLLRYGAKALGVPADSCERLFIPVKEEHLVQSDKARGKILPQLGSLGGGNHFIEMQVDEATGEVFAMVHCGSRGYGWQTAEHFFYAGAEVRGMAKNRRGDSWLRVDEPVGKQYWACHNSAANFAIANRHIIASGVQEATQKVYGSSGQVYYEISHNLIQEETLVLPDGTTKRGFVHRKGATRAMPAGHPDLVGTKWAETGHPCLIPGSMYAGAAILFPQKGAHQTACSVNHGSGRTMGRKAAKKAFAERQADIDAEMRDVTRTLGGVEVEGILCNTRQTPLDECAHVYKDLDVVLDVLRVEGIATVSRRLYPVANLKGMG